MNAREHSRFVRVNFLMYSSLKYNFIPIIFEPLYLSNLIFILFFANEVKVLHVLNSWVPSRMLVVV